MFVADKNYYPKAFTGHSIVATSEADVDGNYIETHEFYHLEKVVFYWKVKKNSSDEVTDFRLSIPSAPATPTGTYQDYDDLT